MPNYHSDDDDFIRAYRNGDRAALERLLKRYTKNMYNCLCRKGMPVIDAEDSIQNIWKNLFEALDKTEIKNFEAYLKRMTRNEFYNWLRRKLKNIFESLDRKIADDAGQAKEAIELISNPNAAMPDEEMERSQRRHILGSCLQAIRNQKLRVLLCLWFKEFRQREMAELLEMKMGAVGGFLHRGKELLQKCVRRKYGGSALHSL